MDYTVHGVAKSGTRLSDFHYTVKNRLTLWRSSLGTGVMRWAALSHEQLPVLTQWRVAPGLLIRMLAHLLLMAAPCAEWSYLHPAEEHGALGEVQASPGHTACRFKPGSNHSLPLGPWLFPVLLTGLVNRDLQLEGRRWSFTVSFWLRELA